MWYFPHARAYQKGNILFRLDCHGIKIGLAMTRIYYHKNKSVSSFSSTYNVEKLVYYEVYEDVKEAIKREKQIKAGSRKKKIDLINKLNPNWKDLYSTIV